MSAAMGMRSKGAEAGGGNAADAATRPGSVIRQGDGREHIEST